MRAGLEVALLLGMVGVSGAFAAMGCQALPECISKEEAETARREGRRADLLLCPAGSSSTGNVTPDCDPSKNPARAVDDTCGVFVSSSMGSDSNDGTKGAPVQTIAKALELLPERPVPAAGGSAAIYLCAEEIAAEQGVTLREGVTLFGGLACTTPGAAAWVYTTGDPANETILTAPEGVVPLRLDPGSSETVLYDIHIVAKTVPDTMAGVSSIAVIADGATARFERSSLEAGNGAKGKIGVPYPDMDKGVTGAEGITGKDACSSDSGVTNDGPTTQCATGGTSRGGYGGPGQQDLTTAGAGGEGEPKGVANAGTGDCTSGSDGSPGMPGTDGGNTMGLGKVDRLNGYIGVSGVEGGAGTPGQGGGGGGGTRSKPNGTNLCGASGRGASGGSGGTGGCGGAGGRGGGPGGASIAVVSINSTLSFVASPIKTGAGGASGEGGSGQLGGDGAPGGIGGASVNGVKAGCSGGKGGAGGAGGKGGKGVGGHSIGVAYTVNKPVLDEASQPVVGAAGEGGEANAVVAFPTQ